MQRQKGTGTHRRRHKVCILHRPYKKPTHVATVRAITMHQLVSPACRPCSAHSRVPFTEVLNCPSPQMEALTEALPAFIANMEHLAPRGPEPHTPMCLQCSITRAPINLSHRWTP